MSSFSQEVKEEITSLVFERHCTRAFLASVIKNIGQLTYSYEKWAMSLKTQSAIVATKLKEMLKENFPSSQVTLMLKDVNNFRKKPLFNIIITENLDELLNMARDYERFLSMPCCRRAFVAGAFVTGGSVNSPEKTNYHLEINTSEEEYAKRIAKIFLEEYGIKYKLILRKNKYILYLKKSELISDTLKIIGGNDAVFKFENVRMNRDIVNSLNRLNNIDISNQQKTLKSAMKEFDCIQKIKKEGLFNDLKPKEKNVCNLRLTHPELSLSELSVVYEKMHSEYISKSTVHNILKRMEKLC